MTDDATAHGDGGRHGAPPSLLRFVNVLLRRRGVVIGCAVLTAAAVVLVGLLLPRTYTATASFTPQSGSGQSNIGGLAAQLGLNVGSSGGSESPQFYVDLLRSRPLLRNTVETPYTFATDTGRATGTLVEHFRVGGESAALRREHAIERLRERVGAAVTPKTGTVTFTVRTYHAPLSQAIAARMLALVGEFNLQNRQTRAAAERRFTERRLAEATEELRAAENRLQAFLERNRAIGGAPTLRFEEERLSREVSRRQRLAETLSEAFERAKIDEVRDTPVITVVEAPEAPVLADRRRLLLKGALGLVAGAVFGVLLVIVGFFFARPEARASDEYREFAALRREALGDVTHPWRPVVRMFQRRPAARG